MDRPELNLNNAIVTSGGLSVDFSQPGVLTAITTLRTGFPSGVVDTVEDFTDAVTVISGSSITVQSAISGQKLTAAVTSNTQFNAPFPCGQLLERKPSISLGLRMG